MSSQALRAGVESLPESIRERILTDPSLVLEDPELLAALIDGHESGMGDNVVDLRGLAMARLEERVAQLEQTRRTVIASAYENLVSMHLVHRAVLELLLPSGFDDFVEALAGPVAELLRVDSLNLVMESRRPVTEQMRARLTPGLVLVDQGFVDLHLQSGPDAPTRAAVLRLADPETSDLHGERETPIRSEAVMRLDFGPGRLPGLLLLGACDPDQFRPGQRTDLLEFMAQVLERQMRRWLT